MAAEKPRAMVQRDGKNLKIGKVGTRSIKVKPSGFLRKSAKWPPTRKEPSASRALEDLSYKEAVLLRMKVAVQRKNYNTFRKLDQEPEGNMKEN